MLHGTTETTLPARAEPQSAGYRQHQSGEEVSRAVVPPRLTQALRTGLQASEGHRAGPKWPDPGSRSGDDEPLQGSRGTSARDPKAYTLSDPTPTGPTLDQGLWPHLNLMMQFPEVSS